MKGPFGIQAKSLLLLLVMLPLISSPALGETETTPVTLNVSQSRNGTVTRELLVKPEAVLQKPTLISTDLFTTDGAAFFPARLIETELASDENAPWLRYLVRFNLDELKRSGEYTGTLILKYEGGKKDIPVSIRVKDPLWNVFPVLLLGVGIGVGLSTYRNERLTQDRILIEVGRLRTQMRATPELANSFNTRINRLLERLDDELERRQWEVAQESMNQARAVWERWRYNQEQWLAQISFLEKLQGKIQGIPANSTIIQTVRNDLEDVERELADIETPQVLRTRLSEISEQINQYLAAHNSWELLNATRTQVNDDQVEHWRVKVESFRQRLNHIKADDAESLQVWEADMQQAMEDIEKDSLPPPQNQPTTGMPSETSEMRARAMFGNDIQELELLPSAPAAPEQETPTPTNAPQRRVAIWRLGSYLTSLALLTWLGYQQIYSAKPTFGANYAEDYLALLAWGFSIEVSRDSVVKSMQSLGIVPENS